VLAHGRRAFDTRRFFSAVLLVVLFLGSGAAIALEEPEPLRPSAPLVLFNGTNLSGWTTWLVDTKRDDPRRVFSVTNGLLRISGNGLGYLATEKAFHDYRLVLEFRWGAMNWSWGNRIGRARDSGIFLHSSGPDGNSEDGNGAFRAAIECQIMQGSVGDLLLIRCRATNGSLIAPSLTVETAAGLDADGWPFWQPAGRQRTIERWGRVNWFGKARDWKDQLDFRGTKDIESATNGWTRVECLCHDDRIVMRVNGVLVNEAFAVSPRAGNILLQCEGSEVYFRRVELWPVESRREK
jgi:hypothetical protein